MRAVAILMVRSRPRWLHFLLIGTLLSAAILLAGCAGQTTPAAEPTAAVETPARTEESPTVEGSPPVMDETPTGEAEPPAADETPEAGEGTATSEETPGAEEGTPGATEGTPESEESPPAARAYQPLDAAACSEIEMAVAETLGVETTQMEAPFQDIVGGGSGTGCEIRATGTGVDFGSHVDVANDLIAMFEEMGWAQDMQYVADSPTATAGGLRNEDALCLFTAGWEPGPAVQCPADQPISACNVAPEQQIYTITVNCARQ